MSDAHSLKRRPGPTSSRHRPEDRPSGVPAARSRARAPNRRRSRRDARGWDCASLDGLRAFVLVIGAGWYWLSGGRYAETTDAYVQADVLDVSTDVSGIVAEIPVHEGQHVTTGQVLFRLDPSKFQIALDQAQANLAQTVLNL